MHPNHGSASAQPRRNRWKQKEDTVLLAHVNRALSEAGCDDDETAMGAEAWKAVADSIPGRTAKQCRERWRNHLDPRLVSQKWTPEEDALIESLRATMGNAWKSIAAHLPGRSETAIKNRHYSHLRRQQRSTRNSDGHRGGSGRKSTPRRRSRREWSDDSDSEEPEEEVTPSESDEFEESDEPEAAPTKDPVPLETGTVAPTEDSKPPGHGIGGSQRGVGGLRGGHAATNGHETAGPTLPPTIPPPTLFPLAHLQCPCCHQRWPYAEPPPDLAYFPPVPWGTQGLWLEGRDGANFPAQSLSAQRSAAAVLGRGNVSVLMDSPHGFTPTATASGTGPGSGFADHTSFPGAMFHDSVPYPPPSVTPPPSAYGHMMASPSFVAHGDFGAMPWAGYSPMGPPSQYHSWQVAQADARMLPGTVPYQQGANGGHIRQQVPGHPQQPSPTAAAGQFYMPQSPRYPPVKRTAPEPSPSVDGHSPKLDAADTKRMRAPPPLQPPPIRSPIPAHVIEFNTAVPGSSPFDSSVVAHTTPSS